VPLPSKDYCLCLPRASFILEGLCLCHRRVFSLICHRTASAFAFQGPLHSKCRCLPRTFAFQSPLPSKAFAFQGTSFVFQRNLPLPCKSRFLCLRSAFGLKPTLRI
jgi:hypothetical protein